MNTKLTAFVSPQAKLLPNSRALEVLLEAGSPLYVKVGLDPTTPSLHWGHALCLFQAAAFQQAGHRVTLLIGTFTATVGDPSGRNAARPPLLLEDTLQHAESLVRQALRILSPDETRIVHNHEWLSRYPLCSLLSMTSTFTVPRLLSRQSFRNRLSETHPLTLNEMLYPILQALDSIHLDADVEIGGRDQIPNFALTRRLQKSQGQEPQVGCTLPLIPGTDGAEKMSSSSENAITLDATPDDTFGRVMSIPDDTLPGFAPLAQLLAVAGDGDDWPGTRHPMQAKSRLAKAMIKQLYSTRAANLAEEAFNLRFSRRQIPDEMPEVRLKPEDAATLYVALVSAGLAASRSEARRLVEQGAIRVDGERSLDPLLMLESQRSFVLSRGRRRHMRVLVGAPS